MYFYRIIYCKPSLDLTQGIYFIWKDWDLSTSKQLVIYESILYKLLQIVWFM
jgi:hypothetical protein